ncbi:hypothetical protein D9613_004575 [Agrocybe pediades]|uniref:Uncharacterized protein n=1 Tax=Agrocybe pediades TaxID=84607 RepID=A0A8H4VJ28_9AGAR|nr:hypothetical protein D9613_004575 [Agrocybe pediades]
MSSISFFGESSDVHIYGGEFNQIRGDMFIFDQSRHSSTVNSFNTTNTIQDNVNNNNSQRYRGIANPPQYRRQRSASPRQPDVASHFPHPTVSPAMAMHLQSQQQLPPGSRMKTIDSFNTTNHTMHNVGNDNSLRYGANTVTKQGMCHSNHYSEEPYPKEKRRPSRRHKATYSDGNYDPGTAEDPSSSSPPVPDPRSSGTGRRRRSSPREDHDASEKQMSRASVGPSSMPAHLNWPTQTNQMTESSVNIAPGDVSVMPTVLQVKLEEVLQMALQHAAATGAQNVNRVPEVAINVEEEGEDADEWEDSSSGSEYEELRGNRLNGHNIADGMANLTLNDTLRPAISRVKSAPPLEDASPGPSNHRPPISNPDPRLAESTQDLPAHLRYPFAYTNNSAVPPFSSQYSPRTAPHSKPNIPAGAHPQAHPASPDSSMYGHTRPPTSPMGSRGPNSSTSKPQRQPPGPASPSFDAQSVPKAFGIQPSFIRPHPAGGSVVFNDIRGNYNKTDQSVHNTIVGSGNTTNTLVQDSYNDNSVRSYAAPRPGKEMRYRK